MRKTYITATVIALLLAGWLATGMLDQADSEMPASIAQDNREQSRISEDVPPTRVRVEVIDAQSHARTLKVRGKTENKRTVDVKVEVSGSVVSRPIERGSLVQKNDLLCELSVEDRRVALIEAREALNQAQIEHQGALRLKEKGYNSANAIAATKARLASAQANLSRRELDLRKTQVRAPFAGIVEDVHQEIGAFVTPGASCATIVDMDPMLLVGRVSESDVIELKVGQTATGYLRNGAVVSGPVTFIGQQSDPTTRTYPVEIELPNPDGALRSGITTEIQVPVESVLAQKVSPALLSLDDAGAIGIRTVDENNRVEFHNVEILADATDGVWVSGLPNRATVIVVGQELVAAGERVDPVYEGSDTMPASAPEQQQAPIADSTPGDDAAADTTASEMNASNMGSSTLNAVAL